MPLLQQTVSYFIMEVSQSLTAIESFSYSWLTNNSFDSLIETYSLDFSDESHNFNFSFPTLEASPFIVPADEIFSQANFSVFSDKEASILYASVPVSISPADKIHYSLVEKWRKSSLTILKRFLGIFRPFRWMVILVKEKRAIDREARRVKSWENLPLQASSSSPDLVGDWSADSSVYEAILYCKRSFET